MSEYEAGYDDQELEELKRRQLSRLQQQRQSPQEAAQRAELEAEEARRQMVLRQALTTEARQRLQNVRMVKPSVARLLEDQIIGLYQAGRLDRPINDATLKQLLYRIASSNSRETSITFRRKGEV
ncbi:MAG: DNA-binding protein [Candidatus Marsarchaeota archaeon]|nr:DNA-binding protein [Candidatus Marsarchaeota archaeon]